jgi:phosphoribosyl-ATP pyrophosphohydrolase/phosphoribosyl-AMP cyclohydrolase
VNIDVDNLWRTTRPDAQGLVPCVVQDIRSRAVLMVAWVSKDALWHSIESGWATFWSRSRGELWEKGATSGNRQRLLDVKLDCDGDTLLYLVEPEGPACHVGHDTCFWRRRVQHGWKVEPESIEVPISGSAEVFRALHRKIESDEAAAKSSATDPRRMLFAGGIPTQAEALRDHAQSFSRALARARREEVAEEAVDLLYHLAVALRTRKIELDQVLDTLASRDSIIPEDD